MDFNWSIKFSCLFSRRHGKKYGFFLWATKNLLKIPTFVCLIFFCCCTVCTTTVYTKKVLYFASIHLQINFFSLFCEGLHKSLFSVILIIYNWNFYDTKETKVCFEESVSTVYSSFCPNDDDDDDDDHGTNLNKALL